METTSGDSCAQKRVGDGTGDIANQSGHRTTGSLDTENNPSIPTGDSEHLQQEECLADTIVEDGINPDDAPEVVWDDINEEVCIIAP
jgi:hypothetical protein